MTTCSLTIIPYGKQPFTVGLLENDGHQGGMEKIVQNSSSANSVFSDLSYELVLNHESIDKIQSVRVYINDAYEPSTYSRGRIYFPDRATSDRRIFLDCYGYVEISLTLVMDDGNEQTLFTEYLPVLVRRGQLNNAVKSMVAYVYSHQENLLLNGAPKPRNLAGLKADGYKSLSAQIILAEEIAAVYESSYGYFKANCRFRIEKVPSIDRLEHLQQVTPKTLEYIASHPEELRPVTSTSGVRIGGRVYQPQKTLSLRNVNSYDLYENRVVLSFLRKMIDEVRQLRNGCAALLQQIPADEDYSPDYIYSSFFMLSETRKMLETKMHTLSQLYDRFVKLVGLYSQVLSIPMEPLVITPKPTAIFLTVPQYNNIFVRIHHWFNFGIYDFAKENFMLSFIKISSLYESYLLAKLINYLGDRGYTLQEAKKCTYPATSPKWKYKNTRGPNTFTFAKQAQRIRLYYQPVIYASDRRSINGIGLYRNNSIPVASGDFDENRQGDCYYSPDYLIEVDENNTRKYLILDAKFSDLGAVKRHHIKDLAFKYLFSISPILSNDRVLGMGIIYGKCQEGENLLSAYNNELTPNSIVPVANILPLIESIDEEGHYAKLDKLFKNLLSREDDAQSGESRP